MDRICIYCKKTEKDTEFSTDRGDEIIPQFLGRFNLYFGDDVVCKKCNNDLGRIEQIFKEGSVAGIHSAIYGIDDSSSSVRVQKGRVSWVIDSDDGELGIFKEAFPKINSIDGPLEPRPIIILDHQESKIKYLLFIEKYAMFAENNNGKEFKKRKEHINRLSKKFNKLNISLLCNDEWNFHKTINLLKQYGLSYNEKKQESFSDKERGTNWNIKYSERGDKDTLRTPAKIAFNYFSYCAKQSGMFNILLHNSFDYMRNYIRWGIIPPDEFKLQLGLNNGLSNTLGKHFIAFQNENGQIVSNINLFGHFSYRVVLGKYPFQIKNEHFGCATVLDPFSKSILTTVYSTPFPIIGKQNFGLFCK